MIDVTQIPRVRSLSGITAEHWNRMCDLLERACRLRVAEGLVLTEDARGAYLGLDLGRLGGGLQVEEEDGSPIVQNVVRIQFDQNEFAVTQVGTGIARVDGIVQSVVRKNSTGSEFTRRRLNFIEGTNVTLTVADDAGDNEVDVTIATSSGGTTLDRARVTRSSNQTFTSGSSTALSFDTEDIDDGGFYAGGSPTRLTMPATGDYEINGLIWWATPSGTPAAGTYMDMAFRKNGSGNSIAKSNSLLPNGSHSNQLHWVGSLTSGDYVELFVTNGHTGSVDVIGVGASGTGESPLFWIKRLA